jgi:hypothetical protein
MIFPFSKNKTKKEERERYDIGKFVLRKDNTKN